LLGVIGIAGSNFTYYFHIERDKCRNRDNHAIYSAGARCFVWRFDRSERITPVKLSAMFLSLLGCAFVVRIFEVQFLNLSKIGLLSGVASALCWAFFNVYGKKVGQGYNVWGSLTFSLMFAGIFWLMFNPP
jgi:hypothetical protein